jgi:hypothetical protein
MLRFGIAREAKYISRYWQDIDVLLLTANSVAHTPKAIATFVGEKRIDRFLVDPLTHAFQHDPQFANNPDSGLPKSSLKKLAAAYGAPVEARLGVERVLPEHFAEHSVLSGFARRVVAFQESAIAQKMDDEGISEYLDFAGIGEIARPAAVVAPYFYMSASTIEVWLGLNVSLVQESDVACDPSLPLLAELVIAKDVLSDDSAVAELVRAYGDLPCGGILLWVDDFCEGHASSAELDRLQHLLTGLRAQGKPVINLYGGFLSMALCHDAGAGLLAGVCHGLEYGEDRAVVPVGGGIPTAKYYLPDLHERLRFVDAARVLTSLGWLVDAPTFHAHVCDCQTCIDTIAGDPLVNFARFGEIFTKRDKLHRERQYPYPETRERSLAHYMNRKRIEWTALASASRPVLVADLRASASRYRGLVDIEDVAGLETFARFLESLG